MIATCCGALFVVTMPNTAQGLYWFTGASAYHLGSTLLLFVIALLIRLSLHKETVKYCSGIFIGLSSLLFLTAGIHVMTLISLLAVMAGLVIREFIYNGKQRLPLVVLLLLVLLLAYVSVSAPGNYQRSLHFPDGGQFWFSVSGAFYWGMRNMGNWIGNPLLWISTAIVIYGFTMLPAREVEKFHPNRISVWLFPVVAAVYLVVLHFPHLWATGVKSSGRVDNVIYFVFLLLWFWYAFICYRSMLAFGPMAFSLPRSTVFRGLAASLALIAFSIMVYIHPNMSRARLDLVGRAHAFHATNLEGYRLLKAHRPGDVVPVVIPDYTGEGPLTIYVSNATNDPGHWENECMAKFFGVESVQVYY